MKEGPRASFNNLLVSIGVSRDAYARPKKGDDKIGTYVEAVNNLLKSNATNANIAKATSEIGRLSEMRNESAVQFADAVRLKAVRCGNAYPDERIKEVFTDDLPVTIRSGVCMFWGLELKAHLTELVQYADTLLDQQHGRVEETRVAPRTFRVNESSRRGTVVAVVEERKNSSNDSQTKSVKKKEYVPTQGYRTTGSGQFKHCRLCLANEHNIEE